MTDDPREILKAAGVECAEVETYAADRQSWYYIPGDDSDTRRMIKVTDAAILALARLVAEYKWMAEHDLQTVLVEGKGGRMVPGERSFQEVYDLGELYREKHQP